jgi:hypothetical protein
MLQNIHYQFWFTYDTYQILSENLENELFFKLVEKIISQTSGCELTNHLVDASIKIIKYINGNWCIDLQISPYIHSRIVKDKFF